MMVKTREEPADLSGDAVKVEELVGKLGRAGCLLVGSLGLTDPWEGVRCLETATGTPSCYPWSATRRREVKRWGDGQQILRPEDGRGIARARRGSSSWRRRSVCKKGHG